MWSIYSGAMWSDYPAYALLAIRTIIESKANESVYKLSRYQIREIRESRRQVQSGQTISNEDLQKEVRKWLRTN